MIVERRGPPEDVLERPDFACNFDHQYFRALQRAKVRFSAVVIIFLAALSRRHHAAAINFRRAGLSRRFRMFRRNSVRSWR